MHLSAMNNGKAFFQVYAQHKGNGTVIDIGSQDVNGTLRSAMPKRFNYIGVDFEKARNVDIVLTKPYEFPFSDGYADIVVTSSCLEHSEFFWMTWMEMVRITKPDGLIYVNAPSGGEYHSYPVDCWRFRLDAAQALANFANHVHGYNVALLESFIDGEGPWHDMVGVYVKDAQFAKQYPDRIKA